MTLPYIQFVDDEAPPRRRRIRWDRLLGWTPSVALHALILAALFTARFEAPQAAEAPGMEVSFVGPLPSPDPTPPAGPPTPEPVQASPPPKPVKPLPVRKTPRPPPPRVQTIAADEDEIEDEPAPVLSDADLAGATVAGGGGAGGGGGGGGGRSCDMVRFLQDALREDPRLQALVERAHRSSGVNSKAMMVWNGDWVRSSGQAGKGLAELREALMWEIGFAPAACRSQPVKGLVLIALNDGPGAVKLAMGQSSWRWTDLTLPRR